MALDLDVIIDMHARLFPLGVFIGCIRQGLQRRSVDDVELTQACAGQFLEGSLIQSDEQFSDGGIRLQDVGGRATQEAKAESSASEKNCRLRSAARIMRSTIWTPTSTLALSRGARTRVGTTATP